MPSPASDHTPSNSRRHDLRPAPSRASYLNERWCSPMKLGLGLPHYGTEASPENVQTFAQKAERLGYDSVWALERLLRPTHPANAPWEGFEMPEYYGTVYDPLQTLMFVAANTTSIRLGTSVIDALFHSPVMLGRQL